MSLKRGLDNENNSDNKRRKISGLWDEFNEYSNGEWVSATSVKNYLMNDPIIDWLSLFRSKNGTHVGQNMLFEMGNKFEKNVVNYLKEKYLGNVVDVFRNGMDLCPELNNLTRDYIRQGVPILVQVPLYNFLNKTFGIADLVVRSDWLDKLFGSPVLKDDRTEFYYCIIDIKWSKMKLCSNGQNIQNVGLFPAYKGQLMIYNVALGDLQGYVPNKVYILGKCWQNISSQSYNCFSKAGVIDYVGFDKKYIGKTTNAIKWVRNVRTNGLSWKIGSLPELYPNMCNKYDGNFHGTKCDIAREIGELTQLWMVGYNNRLIGHQSGIYSWHDIHCSSQVLGINGPKISRVVDKIIEVNRDSNKTILPDIIINNLSNWQTETEYDFYIDIETCNLDFYDKRIDLGNGKSNSHFVFLIGVGFYVNGDWQYKSFMVNEMSNDDERRNIKKFTNFISKGCRRPRLFHWSSFEPNLLKTEIKDVEWIDLYRIFVDEPIVIKGVMKFGLKEIAKNMYSNKLITTTWNTNLDIGNGFDAMFSAIKYYQTHDPKIKQGIIDYNEIDCKVMWDITRYLRRNHIMN